jgi:hypothetical protein
MITLCERLMAALPDFGAHLGYDGKAIDSHSTGRVRRTTTQTSDPDADWGKHETRGIDHKTGKEWIKVKSWFGYGLHLIADTRYETPVAFWLTPRRARRESNSMGNSMPCLSRARNWPRAAATSAPTGDSIAAS